MQDYLEDLLEQQELLAQLCGDDEDTEESIEF